MTYASVWKVVFLSFLLALTACDSPEETEAKHISQGKILYENEEYDKARLEFKNAYQINPTSAEALYHLGLIAEAGKKWKQAYGAYSKVQLQGPAHIGANIHLGRIFLMAGDMDKAISYVDRVLESEVGNVEALALRGAIKFRQDDLAGAETDSLATLKLAPGDIAATTVLAATYRKQGDIQSHRAHAG